MSNISCRIIFKYAELFALALLPLVSISQESRDTIYFDYNWSICEKPAASYYRVCAMEKSGYVFYKGPFEDYFISGETEMIGSYNDFGQKEGAFICYYSNGNRKAEFEYREDTLSGRFLYYDEGGNLRLSLNCKTERDFVPEFVVNVNGDTTFPNADGRFVLTKDDFPEIFRFSSSCKMTGMVSAGEKNGKVDYYACDTSAVPEYSETFRKGMLVSVSKGQVDPDDRTSKGTLQILFESLVKTEQFYHINPLFGSAEDGNKRTVDFVLHKTVGGIPLHAQTFDENFKGLFEVAGYALNAFLSGGINIANLFDETEAGRAVFCWHEFLRTTGYVPRDFNATISALIDTSGRIVNPVFKGNLAAPEIDVLRYYFSNVYGLKPYSENGVKQNKTINLRLFVYADTSLISDSVKRYDYLYVIEDADRKNMPALPVFVDALPKFQGGDDAWFNYISANILLDREKVPKGNYSVTMSFLVDESGHVSEVQALDDPGHGIAEELVRVIKGSPVWMPARKNGKNVAYRDKQNINFKIGRN